jgi:hypothetical protein
VKGEEKGEGMKRGKKYNDSQPFFVTLSEKKNQSWQERSRKKENYGYTKRGILCWKLTMDDGFRYDAMDE